MNYRALVSPFRAALALTEESLCQNCGHKFLNERDIQLDHIDPPQGRQDWERLHARNIRLICGSCNRTKSNKANVIWLAEQEQARRSNLAAPPVTNARGEQFGQPWLFEQFGQPWLFSDN